jgi:hypothetical protein
MELKVNIPEYSEEGLRSEWEDGVEIAVKNDRDTMIILANKAGLISLAKQLLTLAQDNVPSGFHFHFDDSNALENGSTELIIEKK